jgi:histone H3/H4
MPITKPIAKRILKESGPVKVSDEAVNEFVDTLNAYAYRIARKAAKLAKHAKRKTLKKEDIDLAK